MVYNERYDIWHPQGEEVGVVWQLNEWRFKAPRLARLLKGKTRVIQSGGNLGIYPKLLSNLFSEVITLEPVASYYRYLVENTKTCTNIKSFNKGVSDKPGKAEICDIEQGNCGHTVLQETESGNLEMVAIDDLGFSEIDLLWLDVEGYEDKALLGAKNTIERDSPLLIIENNGQCFSFPFLPDHEPSLELRQWVCDTFKYEYVDHIGGDDFFVKDKQW